MLKMSALIIRAPMMMREVMAELEYSNQSILKPVEMNL